MAFTARLGTAQAMLGNFELAFDGSGATTYFVVASGGVVTGGAAPVRMSLVAAGGVVLGGVALTPTVIQVVGTGGVSLSGSAVISQGSIPPGIADPDRRVRKDEVTVFRIGLGN